MPQYKLEKGLINGIDYKHNNPILTTQGNTVRVRLLGDQTPFIECDLSEWVNQSGAAFTNIDSFISTWNQDFSYDAKLLSMISAAFGSRPTTTGAGTKTFTANAYGFYAGEDTTISAFKNSAGDAVVIGWEDVEILQGETIWFGTQIKSMVVTAGGRGQYFLAETDF